MKAVMGPTDRIVAVGVGPAPRTPGRRRTRNAVQTERRIVMGAGLPARRAIRIPRSCAALPVEDEATPVVEVARAQDATPDVEQDTSAE